MTHPARSISNLCNRKILLHYFIHAGPAGRALPLHRLSAILHRDLRGVLHLFLSFALYAISDLCHSLSPPHTILDNPKFRLIIHYASRIVKGITSEARYKYSLRSIIYVLTFSGIRYRIDLPDFRRLRISSLDTSIGVMTTVSTSFGTSLTG